MNKFIKTLIIINGLIIPLIIVVLLFLWIDPFPNKKENVEGIIVGEKLHDAKIDSIALQGLYYDSPRKIYNSKNYYLPISVTTYKEAKNLRKIASSANDLSYSFQHIMNVIFLNGDYEVITTLLDKKASIIDIEVRTQYKSDKEVDTTVKNIGYLIGFEDSNNDGKLNSDDYHDLYISDLNGQNLIKATSGIDIISFNFINSNSEILIRYYERSDLKEEHKKIMFGIFNIQESEFKSLSGLNDTIQNLKDRLIK